MSPRSPFLIDVSDLVRRGGREQSVTIESPREWSVALSRTLPKPPLVAALELLPAIGGLLVRARVTFTAEHTCHRCLAVRTEEMSLDVAQLFSSHDAEYTLIGDEIDLESLIRDEVLLAMPLLPTCPDSCTGPAAGSPDVAEEATAPPSPFAALRDFFDTE